MNALFIPLFVYYILNFYIFYTFNLSYYSPNHLPSTSYNSSISLYIVAYH